MTSLIDTPTDVGNPDRVVQELLEAGKHGQPNNSARTDSRQPTKDDGDPRFRGKSQDQIIDMYHNLERHTGSLANEVGQLRRTTDAILLSKREDDLRRNGGNADPVTIKPSELLENPTEALDGFVSSRMTTAMQPLRDRIQGLEAELASTRLAGTHQDAEQIANSEAFQSWLKETPMRRQVAAMAANGNARATSDLITEFKETAGKGTSRTRQEALDAAEKVTLERSQSGGEGNTGGSKKTYRRSDLIALRQSNPDKYEDPTLQREIIAAYREGRVI